MESVNQANSRRYSNPRIPRRKRFVYAIQPHACGGDPYTVTSFLINLLTTFDPIDTRFARH